MIQVFVFEAVPVQKLPHLYNCVREGSGRNFRGIQSTKKTASTLGRYLHLQIFLA